MQGERRSPKRGQSVEFADYRQYSRGDDFRMIDWNVYARLETLFLKLFVEEEDLTVHLLIDTSRSMDGGTPNKLLAAKQLAGEVSCVSLCHTSQNKDQHHPSTLNFDLLSPPFHDDSRM